MSRIECQEKKKKDVNVKNETNEYGGSRSPLALSGMVRAVYMYGSFIFSTFDHRRLLVISRKFFFTANKTSDVSGDRTPKAITVFDHVDYAS